MGYTYFKCHSCPFCSLHPNCSPLYSDAHLPFGVFLLSLNGLIYTVARMVYIKYKPLIFHLFSYWNTNVEWLAKPKEWSPGSLEGHTTLMPPTHHLCTTPPSPLIITQFPCVLSTDQKGPKATQNFMPAFTAPYILCAILSSFYLICF